MFYFPEKFTGGTRARETFPPTQFFLNFSVGGTEGAALTAEKFSYSRVKGLYAIRSAEDNRPALPPH